MEDDKILLLKLGGIKIRVPREKLSLQDLAYVEDILETEFGSEDNTASDIMQAEESRPDADTPLRTVVSARIISFGPYPEPTACFTIQALLEDGQTWQLERGYRELYDLHMELSAEFPGVPFKALSDILDPFGDVVRGGMPRLDIHLNDLLEPRISTSVAVKQFFAPTDDDDEIYPVDWTEPPT